jgi:hypothetical protein
MKARELSEDAHHLIEEGREGSLASELARARVRRAVATKLASGAVAASLAHTASSLAAAKFGLVLAVAGGVATGVWYGFGEDAATRDAPAMSSPAPVRAQENAGSVPARPPPASVNQPARPFTSAAPAAGAERAAARSEPAAARGARSLQGDLSQEIALLSEASARLNQGDAAGAQTLLARYDREMKQKVLTQERAATGVLVLCQLGNVEAARRAARRFHQAWPRSPLASRITGSCARDAIVP